MPPFLMIPSLFKNWSVFVVLIVTLALSLIIGLFYHHYTSLLSKVNDLKVLNTQFETKAALQQVEIDEQTKALREWVQAQREIQAKLEELQAVSEKAQEGTKQLNDLFGKHKFGELSTKKPGLIQNRVNDSSNASFRMLQCQTGNDSACKKHSFSNK